MSPDAAMPILSHTANFSVACTSAGLPSTDNLRFHQNFVLSFDSAKRNAKWVLEHITKESSSGKGSR
jgi:DNA/RNA endonuclease G (NUC1)